MKSKPDTTHTITRAAELIRQADGLLIAAGAGMGVDSGLPDFRGASGFWQVYPPLRRQRLPFKEMATPDMMRRRPTLAWGFYGHRLNLYRATVPHAGFALLRHWAGRMPGGYFVNTSNVDGQFQKAGFDATFICEVHGSLHHLQCMRPCSENVWPADDFSPQVDEAECRLVNELPRCPHCGDMARPNVLMFNDGSWNDTVARQQIHARSIWLASVRRPVIVEVGAGMAIQTVRVFGEDVCRNHGGHLVRINPREARISPRYGVGLAFGGLEALRGIAQALGPEWTAA